MDGATGRLPTAERAAATENRDATTVDEPVSRTQPGRTKRHTRRSAPGQPPPPPPPAAAVRPTLPVARPLDDDDDHSPSSDAGEQFAVVRARVPDARLSSRFAREDVEDWSDEEGDGVDEEAPPAMRARWEEDQRKMRAAFGNGEAHDGRRESESDSEGDDLLPTDAKLPRDDARKRGSAEPPGRIAGAARTREDEGRRPIADGRWRGPSEPGDLSPASPAADDAKIPGKRGSRGSAEPSGRISGAAKTREDARRGAGEEGRRGGPTGDGRRRGSSEPSDEDDDDERYRRTITTTTTTTRTSGRWRETSRRDELEMRRHRPRSTGDGRPIPPH